MNIIKKTVKDIKDLKIQGATAIALASLKALKKDWQKEKYQQLGVLEKEIKQLKTSRPTEPLLFNCLDYVYWQSKCLNDLNHLNKIIEQLTERLKEIQEEIVKNGAKLIKSGMKIFTHCHSSSVAEIFKEAKKRGKKFQVFLTETRPSCQGRTTAQELTRAGIQSTMVVDSAAAFIISKEDKTPISLILLGCDAIYPQKGVLNKIGSYGIALAAYQAKIPLYIAGSLLKTSLKPLPIEQRKSEEIWARKPRNLKILNLAFDLVPYKFITGMITEFGIIKPEKIAELVKKHYSFIG